MATPHTINGGHQRWPQLRRHTMRYLLLFLVTATVLGCPGSGISGTGNRLVVHNETASSITTVSVTRVPDPCPEEKFYVDLGAGKAGANLLPAPLAPGDSFTVPDLVDGRYSLVADGTGATQTIEGGITFDWYVR